MKRPRVFGRLIRCCLLSILVGAQSLVVEGAAAGHPLHPGERLDYTVSYDGMLSGWRVIPIAKATLEIEPVEYLINGESALSARLTVSTEQFRAAERIYPIRYSFQSWFEPAGRYTLLVDETMVDGKLSQQLVWFDQEQKLVHRFKRHQDKPGAIEALPEFLRLQYASEAGKPSGFKAKSKISLQQGMLDHLSLLYRLRLLELEQGRQITLPASDGKDLVSYRIEVLESERLEREGQSLPALKMRFQPVYRDGEEMPYIYVWYSQDKRRVPLRFYSNRSFGSIDISLDGNQPGIPWRGREPVEPPKAFNVLDDF